MSNNIQDMFVDTIISDLKASSKKEVYKKLANHVATLIGTPENFLLDIINNNEQQQNSSMGNGVAIAHAQLPRLTRPIIVLAKTAQGVDFMADDREPVDLITLVLSPEFEGPTHLQRIAMVARFFNDETARKNLREAENYEDIRSTIKQMNERKKAA